MAASPPAPPARGRRRPPALPVVLAGLLALAGLAGAGLLFWPRPAGAGANSRWAGPLVLPAAVAARAWPQIGRDATHQSVRAGAPALAGRRAWTVHTGGPIISSPVGGNGLVYAGSSDGYLYAVAVADGQVRWRVPIGAKLVNSTPVLAGGLLLVAADYTWLTALDAATGRPVWRFDGGDDVLAPPAADPESGLALFAAGASLFALDLRDGSRRWEVQITDSTPPGWPSEAAPAVAGGRVYWAPGTGRRLFAFAIADGATRWTFDAGDRLAATPVAGDTVDLATWRGHLFALDAASGAQRWERPLGAGRPGEGSESAPALAGGLLFAGSYQGVLYALDARTGAGRWQFQAGGPIVAAPAAGGGLVYCAGEDGTLSALDSATGRPRWQIRLGEMRGSPALVEDTLVIGTLAGDLAAIR